MDKRKTVNRWSVTLKPGESQVSRFDGVKVINKSDRRISVVVESPIRTSDIRTPDSEPTSK